MEVRKSVVKSIQGNGSYDSQFGTMWKFDIEMMDGSHGEYSSKSNDMNAPTFKFKQGQEVAFEYHSGKFPKIKPYSPKPGSPAPSMTPNTDFINSLAGKTIDSNPHTPRENVNAPQVSQTSHKPQMDVQRAIILQNCFTQGNSYLSIVGFNTTERMQQLEELKDVVDIIFEHVIKKATV